MSFGLRVPTDVAEAIALLGPPDPPSAHALAGGTDLLVDLERGRLSGRTLVSLRRLPWRDATWEKDALVLGSLRPLSELERDPEIGRRIPGLATAVRAVGSPALRHRATVGGNLGRCSPASDLIPVLLALDASVALVGPAGERTVTVDRFVQGSRRTALGPGELIRSIRIPARPSAYLWQRVRPANDISQVGIAVARDPSGGWSVAAGGLLPCPRRLPAVERALGSARPDRAAIARAVRAAEETEGLPTDRRASEPYRRHLLGVLLDRALSAVAASAEGAAG